jgi:hypothetical protein
LKLEAMKILPVLGLLSVIVGAGCRSKPPDGTRHWHGCTCQYVTDFDGPGRIDIEVCSAGDSPAGQAESCAQGLGVGAVSACRCATSPRNSPCRPEEACREARDEPPRGRR